MQISEIDFLHRLSIVSTSVCIHLRIHPCRISLHRLQPAMLIHFGSIPLTCPFCQPFKRFTVYKSVIRNKSSYAEKIGLIDAGDGKTAGAHIILYIIGIDFITQFQMKACRQ